MIMFQVINHNISKLNFRIIIASFLALAIFVISFFISNFAYENIFFSIFVIILLFTVLTLLEKLSTLLLFYIAIIPFFCGYMFFSRGPIFGLNVLKDLIFVIIILSWIVISLLENRKPFVHINKRNQYNSILSVFICYMVIQILLAPTILLGVLGFREVVQFMFAFFLGQVFFQTENRIKKCVKIIFTTGIIVALIGILQLVTDLHYNPKIMRLFGVEIHRLTSTLGNPNALGFFLTINILIGVNYLFDKTKKYRRIFLFLVMITMSICLFFTYSRTALIALFVGIIVMAAIKGKTKILFLSVIAFIPTIIFMPSSVVYRYRGIFYGLDAGRRFMWSEAWNRFLQAPIFGVGYGKVGGLYGVGRSGPLVEFMASSIDHVSVVDNSYFFILNETGIIGFGLFCLLLIFIFKKGWSLMRELKSLYLRQLSVCLFSILIALSTAAVTANIFGMVFPINFYFWFLSGILVNLKNVDSNFV